jgi:predicted ATPase
VTNALFKPALSTDQLRAIQERNRGNDDVMTLLWEIKRLQSTVLRAEQLQK